MGLHVSVETFVFGEEQLRHGASMLGQRGSEVGLSRDQGELVSTRQTILPKLVASAIQLVTLLITVSTCIQQ